jgi:hypothetical protein
MRSKTGKPSTRFNLAVTLILPIHLQHLPQRLHWHLKIGSLKRGEGKWRTDHITGACVCAIEKLIDFILQQVSVTALFSTLVGCVYIPNRYLEEDLGGCWLLPEWRYCCWTVRCWTSYCSVRD